MPIRFVLFIVLVFNAVSFAQDPPAKDQDVSQEEPAEKLDAKAAELAKKPATKPVAKATANSKVPTKVPKGVTTSAAALKELNVFWMGVSEIKRSAPILFPAWIAASPMPSAIAPSPENIWPGMDGFADWKKWVVANPALRDAIMKAQTCFVLGIPYGAEGLDAKWKAKGLAAMPGTAQGEAAFGYLNAMRGLTAFTAVSMYIDADAKKFDAAFDLSLAMLRVLRQVSEQRMEAEKLFGMTMMSHLLEANRVYMAANIATLPVATLQRVALKGYAFIKPGENERLKRLELPEGDRIILTESMRSAFDDAGQPDETYFANEFGSIQSISSPLTRFGAAARWRELATVHGPLVASQEKLVAIYDDWWRRWRMRFYDPILDGPTQISKMNQSKYAVVTLFVENLQQVFDARLRLISEIDGTALSAGLCGFYIDSAQQWPKELAMMFPIYGMRRMNFDPFSKDYGNLNYSNLGDKSQQLGTAWGQVSVTGAVLWSLGPDHEDDGFDQHDPADGTGDLVLWPPPRFLARQAGLLK
ncbi:MAG: hypothetical protein EXS12_08805 [Phycisphaerales bacterium]|nr:hypothetical protein [Phycisphaerales bacterium]